MVKVLLDACVPVWLAKELEGVGVEVETARNAGFDGLSDGELLDALEGRYDVLVTRDRNLAYQQRIADRSMAIVVLRVRRQTPDAFKAQVPALLSAIADAKPAHVSIVGP